VLQCLFLEYALHGRPSFECVCGRASFQSKQVDITENREDDDVMFTKDTKKWNKVCQVAKQRRSKMICVGVEGLSFRSCLAVLKVW
jgi:hypothetical protein